MVESFMIDQGFNVSGDFASHRWIRIGNERNVDVFVGLREGDFVSFFPGPRCALKFDEIFPPMSVPLHGVDLEIPKNPFTYLAQVYGAGWRVPDPKFNHVWERSLFSDLFLVDPQVESAK